MNTLASSSGCTRSFHNQYIHALKNDQGARLQSHICVSYLHQFCMIIVSTRKLYMCAYTNFVKHT